MAILRLVQREAWANKVAKGFNTTDVALEFALTHAELSEAFEAYRKHPDKLGEELADVVIFVVGLAEMTGVNLDAAVEAKLAKNAMRRYVRGPTGVLVKTEGESRSGRELGGTGRSGASNHQKRKGDGF
ncbi:MazG-like family protein [Nonomuraea sp. SYSU D8015]|uniref:MazG-like family protein n=1 Tax=Nonomuraea sp. SYSU D8015 TaxID=2593644 RepID=UPI0016616B47|nr:MazG nucleotide pyrophosphohydrolase domain-containing protein [Nonomuraea sp. SYSU D8015]